MWLCRGRAPARPVDIHWLILRGDVSYEHVWYHLRAGRAGARPLQPQNFGNTIKN